MNKETMDRILDTINRFKELCYDIDTTADDLDILAGDEGIRFDIKGQSIKPTVSAKGQLLTKIKVPVNFFDRCPLKLQQDILDYFNTDRTYMLRCVHPMKEGEGEECRAVVSDVYTKNYDNHLTFPPILKVLEEEEVLVKTFSQADIITRLELKLIGTEIEYQNRKAAAGIMITNSETGHSSLWIEPVIFIGNGYVLGNRYGVRKDYNGFRMVHKGQGVEIEQVEQAVAKAKEAAQVGVIQYFEALKEVVKPERAIEFMKSIPALPNRFVNLIEDEWSKQEKIEKERVVREILTAAQELPILNKIQVEQATGKWLGIFDNYMKRLDGLMTEVGKYK